MGKQNYLVDLVRSLSPHEKRYFKLYTNIQSGAKSYLKLYELLQGGVDLSNEELCKKLKLKPKQLADEKDYLQQVLLRALRHYESDVNPQTSLVHRFLEAEMLLRRRMPEYALTHLDKTYQKTIDYEQHTTALHNLRMRINLVLNRPDPNPEFISPELMKRQLAELAEVFEYEYIYLDFMGPLMERKDLDAIREILNRPAMRKNPDELMTTRAQALWYIIHNYGENLIGGGKSVKGLAYAEKLVELFERKPEMKTVMTAVYLGCYVRIAESLPYTEAPKALKMVEKGLVAIEQYKGMVTHSYAEQLRFNALLQKALVLNYLTRFAEAAEVAKGILNFKLNILHPHMRMTLVYIYCTALTLSGHGERALEPLRELLKGNKKIRLDLQFYAMLLDLMIQYDMGNYSVIPYLVAGGRSWIKRRNYTWEDADAVLKWMQRLSTAAISGKEKAELTLFLKVLDAGEVTVDNETLNVRYWIRGKLKHL